MPETAPYPGNASTVETGRQIDAGREHVSTEKEQARQLGRRIAVAERQSGRRFGKPHFKAAATWCAMHPGEAVYVSLESGRDIFTFFRCIARAIGTACSGQMKAAEMRMKIEDMLQEKHLTLVIDEAHYLFPLVARPNSSDERWSVNAVLRSARPFPRCRVSSRWRIFLVGLALGHWKPSEKRVSVYNPNVLAIFFRQRFGAQRGGTNVPTHPFPRSIWSSSATISESGIAASAGEGRRSGGS